MKVAAALLLSILTLATTGFCRDEYIITKIQPNLVSTPNVGGDKRHSGDDKWLAVDVDFKSAVDLTDELTFTFNILFAGKYLTGESTYVNIEKGKDMHVVMYVSPRTLRRLMLGKYVSPNNIENVTVRITSKGQVAAERSLREMREWWKGLEPVKGAVLKKSETPFAWVDWDYYEELKPETH